MSRRQNVPSCYFWSSSLGKVRTLILTKDPETMHALRVIEELQKRGVIPLPPPPVKRQKVPRPRRRRSDYGTKRTSSQPPLALKNQAIEIPIPFTCAKSLRRSRN